MKRKLPPFGNRIRGRKQIKIYTSADNWSWRQCKYWNDGTRHIGATLLPDDTQPEAMDWRFVCNADVMVLQRNRYPIKQIEALGACLVRAGAASVGVAYASGDSVRFDWYLQPGGISHAAA